MDGALFDCARFNPINYVVGVVLCVGAIGSYIPQYYSIIKQRTSKGLSEISLFILNFGSFCVTSNSLILQWDNFKCFRHDDDCSWWMCLGNLLPFFQILAGWVMVTVLYLIFLWWKIRGTTDSESEDESGWEGDDDIELLTVVERYEYDYASYPNDTRGRILYNIMWFCLYAVFVLVVVLLSIFEDFFGSRKNFFVRFAQVLGGISAFCSLVVWVPQIIMIIRTKNQPNTINIWMFALQAPGSAITVIFQAVLYKRPISTWITYAVTCIQQLVVVGLVIGYTIHNKRRNSF